MESKQSDLFPIRVEYSTEFKKNLKKLSKKYRKIKTDIDPLLEELQQRNLIPPGDRIQGIPEYVYKVRLKNSDLNKGKSHGYRVIYLMMEHNRIVLLTIYSKPDQPNIMAHQIAVLLKELRDS
jgi:mRNA-degrading endonuclease RelE of RelBE toxin-antitoxin system